jgi:endonuclease/exonuclease/phosphatase family metal-dependent hydrolase
MRDPIWVLMSELKKRMKNKSLLFCILLLSVIPVYSQNATGELHILFYNVENLFDITDDPLTLDEEYTPKGGRRWTYKRMNKKILDVSKVLLNAAGWNPPHIISLCEIENRYVLERLTSNTPLKFYSYKIIHKESPDSRGIDVALLYDVNAFNPVEYRYIPLYDKEGKVIKTREILYVCGIVHSSDTLHFFFNHWPSRFGGLLESRPARDLAAHTLRTQVEAVQEKHLNPRIIIAGDFNDQPTDQSLLNTLGALPPSKSYSQNVLYNLSFPWMDDEIKTIKYQSQWSVFDQIIVSGSLLDENEGVYTRPEWAEVVKLPFLLEDDPTYGGKRIRRTYVGYRYNGGFSDHLPVILKVAFNF